MTEKKSLTRRTLIKSSVLGLLGAATPNVVFSKHPLVFAPPQDPPHGRYPAIQLEIAAEVVGVSHFNLDRLKQLVDPRPELANAIWDFGFGDWESAIAAASHVGRHDIVEYLMSKGAAPTIFTFAMMGSYDVVKGMIEACPGVQKKLGPHGISLLKHAKEALSSDKVDRSKAQQLVDYLQSLGDADGQQYLPMEETEKEKYLGDYKYGTGDQEGFSVKLNMRKMIGLGKIGKNGGALLKIGENKFTYQGAPSVIVSFEVEAGKVLSLTISEPGFVITALKI